MGCTTSTLVTEPRKSAGHTAHTAPDEQLEPYEPLTSEEINLRIQSCEKTLTHRLGDSGITLRYAYLSQRGYYPEDLHKSNQDAFRITPSIGGESSSFFAGVFDGHGAEGDTCSAYVRDTFEPRLRKAMDEPNSDLQVAHTTAFAECNVGMHEQDFDDSMSGTTAITAYFRDRQLVIANIGDSRAIMGEKKGQRVIAHSLSMDQTPYRADERARVKKAGAVVMSCDQLEGFEPYHENWGVELGEEVDNGGDPPRLWAPGQTYPGCAFTRSIGDNLAEAIGVNAVPELLLKELTPNDKFIVLASDGVWEFLTNQAVTDMILKFKDPLEACRAVVAEAYRLWLQYEVRTDDITMIIIFLDFDEAENRKTAGIESMRSSAQSSRTSADYVAALQLPTPSRPVRRGVSKEKRAEMAIGAPVVPDEDLSDFVPALVPKTDAELGRIKSAVKANFLFQHLSDTQSKMIFNAMVRTEVKAGEVVIQQGSAGDVFYIVDAGEYLVTVQAAAGSPPVEVMRYTAAGGTNPCFGELAILHNKPRAATVTCVSAGALWAIDRRSFRAVLMRSSSNQMRRTLRSVPTLKPLTMPQLRRLEELLIETTYRDGEHVVKQGDCIDALHLVVSGCAALARRTTDGGEDELSTLPDLYFGELALLGAAPSKASVVAKGPLRCAAISKRRFEEEFGPLQAFHDAVRKQREAIVKVRRVHVRHREAQGPSDVSRGSFALHGLVTSNESSALMFTRHRTTGEEYTLRASSKAQAEASGMASRLMAEATLLQEVPTPSPFVPIALTHWHDETHLYSLFKERIVGDLQQLLDIEGVLDEASACFYGASVALALEHLHAVGIVSRNLSPDALALDANGRLQLWDLRFAVRLEDEASVNDICGAGLYFAPEQVAQLGHGFPVDYWQLGVLLYQLTTGSVPWIGPAEDADSVAEVDLYRRIATHVHGGITTATLGLSAELDGLINDLLHPTPSRRLGCGIEGPRRLSEQPWFAMIDFEALMHGNVHVPSKSKSWCEQTNAASARARSARRFLSTVAPTSGAPWSEGFGRVV